MGMFIRFSLVAAALAATGLAVIFHAAYRATQDVPEFYQKALKAEPAKQQAAGDELEREVLELHNEVRKPGRWEAAFSQDQINGWLAADLPEKFPGALPRGVSDPRVAIEPHRVQLAVKYDEGDISTVLSLTGDMYLTDQPNEVAVHIQHVRAGSVPIPLGQFLDHIADRATRAGLPLRWTEQEGSPVALIRVPLDRKEFRGRNLQIEQLEMQEGQLVVSGRTEEPETTMTAGPPLDEEGHSDENSTRQR